MDSILNSIKKMLGIPEEYEVFDVDIITYINTVFLIVQQLGIGPEKAFVIVDSSSTWNDFWNGMEPIEALKTYIYMKVRTMFDPPQSGSAKEALENCIKELESRLNYEVDPKGENNE